jgi:uncharacterized protein YndB with AHSA1/START domain
MLATYSMDVNAPIEKVFNCVEDTEKMKLWMDGLEETTYVTPRDLANPVGTKFKQKIREGGRVQEYDGEVLAYEKPKLLAVRIGNKYFHAIAEYRFTPTHNGTRMDYNCDVTCHHWFFRIMMVLFSWFTKRILRKQMTKLKALAER